jgi:photosystem II stability/assembly factor-like uncharacterized protein
MRTKHLSLFDLGCVCAPLLLFVTLSGVGQTDGFAQDWTNISASPHPLNCIASSADGTKLVAASMLGGVYTSTNSGYSWNTNNIPAYRWNWTASSADGSKLAIVGGPGDGSARIYTSTNSGSNWTLTDAPITNWYRIAMSADGNTLVAGGTALAGVLGLGNGGQNPAQLHISTNFGLTWTNVGPKNGGSCLSIASGANGAKWVAALGGQILTSTDNGNTWTSNNLPAEIYTSVASSADGTKLVAAVANDVGLLFTSNDGGGTWTSNAAPAFNYPSIASSADGRKLVVVDTAEYAAGEYLSGGLIYTSDDGGSTWIKNNVDTNVWNCVASSADGDKLVATTASIGVYARQITPTPLISMMAINHNLTLSWVVPSQNFNLRQNSYLSSTGWTDVPDLPVLNPTNLQCQITLPMINSQGFYRLNNQ